MIDSGRMRRTGLTLAALLSVAVAALLGYSLFRGSASSRDPRAHDVPEFEPPVAPVASGSIRPGLATPDAVQDVLQSSADARIDLLDENGRLAQALTYERLEPLEAGRFRITRPRAHVFMSDGRVVEVQAQSGQYVQRRARQEPESGWFRGDVQVRVFEPVAEGAPPRAPDDRGLENLEAMRGAPRASVFTDAIAFDLASGEVRSDDPIRLEADVSGDRLTFSGRGLTILLSEKDRRLLYLKIDQGDAARLTRGETQETPAASDTPDDVQSAAATEGETPVVARTQYRAEFGGPVRVTAGASRVDADVLEVWLRTVDGAIPSGAVAPMFAQSLPRANEPATEAAKTATARSPDESRDELTLEWSGALTVRPLDVDPPELLTDDVFIRFSSPRRGLVRFEDSASGAEAEASAMDYGLKSRMLTLSGIGARGALLRAPDAGEAFTSRIEADLARGVVSIPGPGTIAAIGEARAPADPETGARAERDISWRGRADLWLTRTEEGALTLRQAVFTGGARAREGALFASGDSMRAVFRQDERARPTISRFVIEGGALADAGADGRVSAQRVDVAFEAAPDGGAARPTVATAEGAALAEREGSTIRAETLEARLAPDADGRTRIETIAADLGVLVRVGEGANAIEARADRLRATPADETVDLIDNATISQPGRSVRGRTMRIVGGASQTLTVIGAGAAEQTRQDAEGDGPEHMLVEWTGSMVFDDLAGRAECAGEVVATADSGPTERHTLRADRLLLTFTPRSVGASEEARVEDRRLLRAEAVGRSEEEEGAPDAAFESRRYVEDATSETGLRLEGLAYLSGARLITDTDSQTLYIPGTGKLLVEDRRTRKGAGAPPGAPEAPAGSPLSLEAGGAGGSGTTLMEWDGSALVRYATRDGEAGGRVRLRHLPLQAGEAFDLECERLHATFSAETEELREAEAGEGVFARRGARQLTGDRLLYRVDNGKRSAEVSASAGNVVTIFDERTGQSSTAGAITWDLERDRIRATDSGPVRAPR